MHGPYVKIYPRREVRHYGAASQYVPLRPYFPRTDVLRPYFPRTDVFLARSLTSNSQGSTLNKSCKQWKMSVEHHDSHAYISPSSLNSGNLLVQA